MSRFTYSTVGYGVFSLLGERYRMGRIEIFDREEDSGYAVNEGTYCMPFEAAAKFEEFIEALGTEYPINIEIGSHKECQNAVSEELGIPVDKLNDTDTKKAFYKKKTDEWSMKTYGVPFDEHIKTTPFYKKHNEKK